jgi:hypothetical protein
VGHGRRGCSAGGGLLSLEPRISRADDRQAGTHLRTPELSSGTRDHSASPWALLAVATPNFSAAKQLLTREPPPAVDTMADPEQEVVEEGGDAGETLEVRSRPCPPLPVEAGLRFVAHLVRFRGRTRAAGPTSLPWCNSPRCRSALVRRTRKFSTAGERPSPEPAPPVSQPPALPGSPSEPHPNRCDVPAHPRV